MSDLIALLLDAKKKLIEAPEPTGELYYFMGPNEYEIRKRQGEIEGDRMYNGAHARVIHHWPDKPIPPSEYEARKK